LRHESENAGRQGKGGGRRTNLSTQAIEARDEDIGGEEAAHCLPAVHGELPAVQVLVDLRCRPIPGAVTGRPYGGGGGGWRFPQLSPLGLAAVGARGPLGWKHSKETPAQKP